MCLNSATPELGIEPTPPLLSQEKLFQLVKSEAKSMTSRNIKPKRIIVNFLRHKISDYEDELRRIPKGRWAGLCRRLLRGRIYSEISQTYPFLATECARQA